MLQKGFFFCWCCFVAVSSDGDRSEDEIAADASIRWSHDFWSERIFKVVVSATKLDLYELLLQQIWETVL